MGYIDNMLNKYFSKKLFAYLVVTVITGLAIIFDANVPPEYYGFSAVYVGGQSFVDRYIKVK